MIERRKLRHTSCGFTLIELAVSVSIITLIGALSLVSFANSRRVRDLTSAGQSVLSLLQLAQTKAIGGESAVPWGVHVEQSQVVLFSGPAYGTSPRTSAYAFPSTIEIVNIALAGGGSDTVFKRITGATDQSGTFLVRVTGSATQVFPVTIDPSGKAYQTGTAPVPLGTRITDARHRAFTLGWSIQNAATLTLNFNDLEFISSVPMAAYFNADKSAFDWSGTVNVNGQIQTLRIHTVSLTTGNTILHVDRDCRKNTKKLNISIDGKDIATYQADCRTVNAGAFGGSMSEP